MEFCELVIDSKDSIKKGYSLFIEPLFEYL